MPDLTPFMRWIPDLDAATDASGQSAAQKTEPKLAVRESAGVVTKPAIGVPHCGCKVLPWEECEHTAVQEKA